MCPDTAILSAYFDEETSEAQTAAVEQHLESCPACRATMELFAAQRRALRDDVPAVPSHDDRLEKFWNYVGQARIQRVSSPRRLSVPIPLAAAAVLALVAATLMNFLPSRNDSPDVVVLEAVPQAPTVVSLTITPGELDEFFALLEGDSQLSDPGIHTLPADFPVSRLGEPQMVRPASLEGAP